MQGNPFQTLFVPGGRLSRMSYFVATLVAAVVTGVLLVVFAFGAFAAILSGNAASAGSLGVLSLLAIAAVVLAYIYVGAVVSVKRLHYMGQPGWHVIWIFAAGFIGGIGSDDMTSADSLVGAVGMIAWLAGSFWLLFAPGDVGGNAYGSEPA